MKSYNIFNYLEKDPYNFPGRNPLSEIKYINKDKDNDEDFNAGIINNYHMNSRGIQFSVGSFMTL